MSSNRNNVGASDDTTNGATSVQPTLEPWWLIKVRDAVQRPGRGVTSNEQFGQIREAVEAICAQMQSDHDATSELLDRVSRLAEGRLSDIQLAHDKLSAFNDAGMVIAQIVGILPRTREGRSTLTGFSFDEFSMVARMTFDPGHAWILYGLQTGVVELHEPDKSGADVVRMTVTVGTEAGARLAESDLDALRAKLTGLDVERSPRRVPGPRGSDNLPVEVRNFLDLIASAGRANGMGIEVVELDPFGNLTPWGPHRH
jgi:hypothetical protein